MATVVPFFLFHSLKIMPDSSLNLSQHEHLNIFDFAMSFSFLNARAYSLLTNSLSAHCWKTLVF